MKPTISILCVLLAVASVHAQNPREVLYQLSTMHALQAGVYDGFKPYSEITPRGDFGIGTFENINGEMIELDGTVYQVLVTGEVVKPNSGTLSPYATVTFFDEDQTGTIADEVTYEQIKPLLDAAMTRKGEPVAIRLQGTFDSVKTRSVPAQDKPYPTLDKVVAQQAVFEFTNVTGTAVGFWFPPFMSGVQAAGYHLHFLNDARNAGGHLLDFRARDLTYTFDYTPGYFIDMPGKSGEL